MCLIIQILVHKRNRNLKTHCTHRDTCFQLTYWDEKYNLRQSQNIILLGRSGHFNPIKRHIVPIRLRSFCVWVFLLAGSGQLSPSLERPNFPIQFYYSISLDQFEKSSRTSLSLEQPNWLV